MKYLYMLLAMIFFVSYHNHAAFTREEVEASKRMISLALKYPTRYNIIAGHKIGTEYEAIEFAEPILFRIFGEDDIRDEKPYMIDLVDGFWIMEGSLPKETHGGTFHIIFSANNGRVIQLYHDK
ncbi:NTF2 fold immunity protein [Mucilaginibacter sp. cycad4]|uniref:NTF2 fold immunity protein n=1 Tax=Mucilaginibacter sp. cycad4 TaxID=3342096 RepID=UPI002AAB6ABE|nr:NTF2 fold immunity protein [Mucilaginibacter gossypii]WPV02715.1 NTF2 fold immunity protein [Mucilaginibacter gossypii]